MFSLVKKEGNGEIISIQGVKHSCRFKQGRKITGQRFSSPKFCLDVSQ